MTKRILLFVIDGFGIGALPDAADYGDADANTLAHLADVVGGLSLPTFEVLGLGHLAQIRGVRSIGQPHGCFGRLSFMSQGKDSITGYWELGGIAHHQVSTVFHVEIPDKVVAVIEQLFGRKSLGRGIGLMGAMLRRYGMEHLATGAPLLWTDGARTCWIAMHESAMPPAEFQQRCREIRKTVKDAGLQMRVVAQPITGTGDALRPQVGRKDWIGEPPGLTLFDSLSRAGQIVMGIGKVYDLFSGRGLTTSVSVEAGIAGVDEAIGMLSRVPRGLICASLDLLSEDAAQAAANMQEFDRRLSELFKKLQVGDMVIVTGDHGRDLSLSDKTSTREYVPLCVTGPKLAHGVDLGTRDTAADVGQTIVDALGAERLLMGESFLNALMTR